VGHTFARVRLYNPGDQSKILDLDLIVDTGSTYTWVKQARLRSLGLKPKGRKMFRTIEGKLVEREIGEALIECGGDLRAK
jgi:predicted aspartyl protease